MPTNIIAKAKELAAYQEKVAKLQEEMNNARAEALTNLHEEYGFADADELIRAIRAAAGARRARRPGRPAKKAGGHKKHARITPGMRQQIKAALKAGKTGGQVAADFGISLPSVYNIKKEFGLVRARKTSKTKKPGKARKALRAKKSPKAEKSAVREKAPSAET